MKRRRITRAPSQAERADGGLAPDELRLRVVVERPLTRVAYGVQRGRDGLLAPCAADASAITFEFVARVSELRPRRAPRFLGEFVHGPPDERFVYVNTGKRAGDPRSPWDRRAKLHLCDVRREDARRALGNSRLVLEARIEGTARDGGPACASVPLLGGDWRVRASNARTRTARRGSAALSRPSPGSSRRASARPSGS